MKLTFTKTLIAITVSTIASVTGANAQSTASETASIEATLVTPISITKDSDMSFGKIANSSEGGTVTLAANGTATMTGGLSAVASGGTPTAAAFTVRGDAGNTFNIEMPTVLTLTGAEGNTTPLEVALFTNNPDSQLSNALTNGINVITVGGTFTVLPGTVAGTYSNATGLTVTVNYN